MALCHSPLTPCGAAQLEPELSCAVSIPPQHPGVFRGNWEFPHGHWEFPGSSAGSLWQSPRGGSLGLNSQSWSWPRSSSVRVCEWEGGRELGTDTKWQRHRECLGECLGPIPALPRPIPGGSSCEWDCPGSPLPLLLPGSLGWRESQSRARGARKVGCKQTCPGRDLGGF